MRRFVVNEKHRKVVVLERKVAKNAPTLSMNSLYFKVALVFTPSTPVGKRHLFAGRKQQIKSLVRAVSGQGSHAIIFGERGVGKSSLGRVVQDSFLESEKPNNEFVFASVDCQSGMRYSALWMDIFDRISVPIPRKPIGLGSGEEGDREFIQLSTLVRDQRDITTQEVRFIFERRLPPDYRAVILIDEVDRLPHETKRALADTIKSFSDYNSPVKLILIGVGGSVEQLIEGHQSVDRALVQIHMPRMTDEEIDEVITIGLADIPMTIDAQAKKKIIALSRGLPYYTHLIMLHAGQSAAERSRTHITEQDFQTALSESVLEKERTLKNEYTLAIHSTKAAYLYPYVLLACALAHHDSEGYFSLSDVQEPLSAMLGEEIELSSFIRHAGAFCTLERGPVLEKTGRRMKHRYRFSNPLMPTYVLMRGIHDNTASHTPIEELLLRN